MSEIGLVEIFSMGEAVALIGTLFVILYFSRKQAQSLSVDIETKVLNDLAERMHTQVQILIGRPQLTKVLSKVDAESPELADFQMNKSVHAHFLSPDLIFHPLCIFGVGSVFTLMT